MNLRELLQKHSDDEILSAVSSLYDNKDIDGYKAVLPVLRTLEPSDPGGFRIVLSPCHDIDSGYFTDVSGKNGQRAEDVEDFHGDTPDDEISWALDFTSWAKWLAMDIDRSVFWSYTEVDALAHILWEMSFHGFSEDVIRRHEKEMVDAGNDTDVVRDLMGGD